MQLTRVVVTPKRKRRWPIVVAGLPFAVLCLGWIQGRALRCFCVSKTVIVQRHAEAVAVAYAQATRYRATSYCPRDLAELGLDTADPWGHAYGLVCDGHSIAVISAGPDRAFGTSDDITGGTR